MAKKHSDKELQNMSVEELQSLMNDILPQKERPNYDTRTSGGRDYTGVCCDIADGCCDSACTLCDGICSPGETCSPDNYIDPSTCPDDCGVCCDTEGSCCDSACTLCDGICSGSDVCMDPSTCPSVTYPSFTVVGGWDGSDQTLKNAWRFVAYPYADEFHDGTNFTDILDGALSAPIENGSLFITMVGNESIGLASMIPGGWYQASGDISSTVKGMIVAISSMGSDKILNWDNGV